MDGEISLSIDMEKFDSDGKWGGLKGYLTNTRMSNKEIMEKYAHLWKIEKAFRISKHDLKIRPVYHWVQRRIEALICISFVAYKIYKELERLIKLKGSMLSPEIAIDIAKTIYAIQVKTPKQQHIVSKTIFFTKEKKALAKMFNF